MFLLFLFIGLPVSHPYNTPYTVLRSNFLNLLWKLLGFFLKWFPTFLPPHTTYRLYLARPQYRNKCQLRESFQIWPIWGKKKQVDRCQSFAGTERNPERRSERLMRRLETDARIEAEVEKMIAKWRVHGTINTRLH